MIHRRVLVARLVGVLVGPLLLAGTPAAAADAPLTLALTPSRDPTALQEAGDAFVRTITRLSGVPMRAKVASDYAGVVEALRSRHVDLAFVHPVGYVLAHREAGCQILVRDIWQGRIAYTARFYVRADSGIQRVEDLRGKTVAFVDPASSSGYIYPMVLLLKQGLVRDRDPKSFFKEALFAGTHDAALRAVLQGRVDAAASFDKAPELYLKDPAQVARLSHVGETPPIPGGRDLRPARTSRRRAGARQEGAPGHEGAGARHRPEGHLQHRRLRRGLGRRLSARSRSGQPDGAGPAEVTVKA